ncbi:MAG TPA: hypothetical protein VGZ00_09835 [Candidatus Baltobacteraceae bacterium]|nr:hypothetical protein [Candidatus Baltobacteraceae bacterium]
MPDPIEADLEIPAARNLFNGEREMVLALPEVGTVSELCRRAGIRCRVTGGREARVVLWDGPGHGSTQSANSCTVFAIDRTKLPPNDPERSLRILEVLAYGCFDYAARESVCGQGYFVVRGRSDEQEKSPIREDLRL